MFHTVTLTQVHVLDGCQRWTVHTLFMAEQGLNTGDVKMQWRPGLFIFIRFFSVSECPRGEPVLYGLPFKETICVFCVTMCT